MTSGRRATLVAGALIAVVVSAARLPLAQVPPVELPEGEGRAAILTMCSDCHGLGSSVNRHRTVAEWGMVVDMMRQQGAPGSDDEAAAAKKYLIRHFGRVNVNTAGKGDLQAVLGVTEAVALAIVEFRTANGAFHTLDDLKKVPGLEASVVDAHKASIVFETP